MTMQDDSLRWRLRDLRQDTPPQRDLWPGIAARIAAAPQVMEAARPSLGGRWAPWAMAASVLLAVGLVWQQQALPDAEASLFQREAMALTREYQGALAQFGDRKSVV